MGQTLRELTGNNTEGLIQQLIKAYSDEILAWYLYYFMAQSVSGELYPQLKNMLEGLAKDEKEHSEQIADMIVKLGGKIPADPMELEEMANFPVVIPSEPLDLKAVCDAVAESEKGAITVYNSLSLQTKDTNIPVYTLISEILSDEIDHEELFENLTK